MLLPEFEILYEELYIQKQKEEQEMKKMEME